MKIKNVQNEGKLINSGHAAGNSGRSNHYQESSTFIKIIYFIILNQLHSINRIKKGICMTVQFGYKRINVRV